MSDLIKRSDAINAINQVGWLEDSEYESRILAIPSADRPRGEWIHDYHFGLALPEHKCSVCGEWEYSDTESNYCPHCGARMKDVTEGLESRTDLIWYGDKTDLIGDETGRHTGWFGKGADNEH